jgi:hypothetical protein
MPDTIETALFELGGRIDFPDTPELTDDVAARLTLPDSPKKSVRWWLVAAAVVAFLVLALPGPRAAIADLLGIGAVQISLVDSLPRADALGLLPGDELSLDEAVAAAPYPILSPGSAPDVVVLHKTPAGPAITAGYGRNPDGYRLLVTQIPAGVEEFALQKLISPATTVTPVDVHGAPGFWIEGGPHVVVLIADDGSIVEDSARLVGNTLLFERDGVTVRIEGGFDLAQALQVAARLS